MVKNQYSPTRSRKIRGLVQQQFWQWDRGVRRDSASSVSVSIRDTKYLQGTNNRWAFNALTAWRNRKLAALGDGHTGNIDPSRPPQSRARSTRMCCVCFIASVVLGCTILVGTLVASAGPQGIVFLCGVMSSTAGGHLVSKCLR